MTMQTDTLKQNKETWFQKQREVSEKIVQAINKIKEHKEQRDQLTQFVQDKKDQRNTINEQIKEVITQLKDIKPQSQSQVKKVTLPKGMSFGKLKKEAEQLERAIETAGVSFDKEKQMMKKLKEKKKLLDESKNSYDSARMTGKLGKKLRLLKKESDAIHHEIQDAAKRSQEEHEALLQLAQEVDTLRKDEKIAKESYLKIKKQLGESTHIPKPRKMENQQMTKRLETQKVEVAEKIKTKRKLTTEDLLVFQTMGTSDAGDEAAEKKKKAKDAESSSKSE
ncbi:MAG: hypothetical protein ACMXYF_04970 [Candidatus Woesearchaeota archaeon]